MDPVRFDTLIKTLSTAGTRRALLRLLTAVPVAGGLLALGDPEALAGKHGKDGKHGRGANGGQGGKGGHGGKGGKGRKGKSGRSGTRSVPAPAPTCTDGIQNQGESDIDGGGPCPRCANGQTCASRDDCASAYCVGGTCQRCDTDSNCGDDGTGPCSCVNYLYINRYSPGLCGTT